MSLRLSHSSIEKYKQCPRKWYYHYRMGLRPHTLSSALFFGTVVGNVFQKMLMQFKHELSSEEQTIHDMTLDEYVNFMMNTVEINKLNHDAKTCHLIRYYKKDFDSDLLDENDWNEISEAREASGLYQMIGTEKLPITFDQYLPFYYSGELEPAEYSFMNLHFWLSLRKKLNCMIDSFKKEILPRVVQVHSLEKELIIQADGSEDVIYGKSDVIMDYKIDAESSEKLGLQENDIVKILFDLKSSSARYAKNKITTDSQQLALYEVAENIGLCGYIVAVKEMKCPKRGERKGETYCDIQVLIDRVPVEKQDEFLGVASEVLDSINNEKFEHDTDGCKAFGMKCEYYDMCHEGKDSSYLFHAEIKC